MRLSAGFGTIQFGEKSAEARITELLSSVALAPALWLAVDTNRSPTPLPAHDHHGRPRKPRASPDFALHAPECALAGRGGHRWPGPPHQRPKAYS